MILLVYISTMLCFTFVLRELIAAYGQNDLDPTRRERSSSGGRTTS